MIYTLSLITIISYVLAAAYQAKYLFKNASKIRHVLIALCLTGLICHFVMLYQIIPTDKGIDFSIFRIASIIGLFIMALTFSALLRKPIDNLLIVACPITAIAVGCSLIPTQQVMLHNTLSNGMLLHIFTSILAYSVIFMAMVQAIVLFIQEKQLKLRHLDGIIQRFPPLQTMESMLIELVWVGFILLGASILSGILFIDNIFSQHLAHKIAFSGLAWLLFSILLWGRYRQGWSSYTIIRCTVGGFLLLMLGYFGSKFVLELILKYN